MQLPTEAIEEFQSIWEQFSGDSLDSDTAATQAQKTLVAMEAIFNNQTYANSQQRTPVPTPISFIKNKEPRLQNEALPNSSE